jgi:hypothetical protein
MRSSAPDGALSLRSPALPPLDGSLRRALAVLRRGEAAAVFAGSGEAAAVLTARRFRLGFRPLTGEAEGNTAPPKSPNLCIDDAF